MSKLERPYNIDFHKTITQDLKIVKHKLRSAGNLSQFIATDPAIRHPNMNVKYLLLLFF